MTKQHFNAISCNVLNKNSFVVNLMFYIKLTHQSFENENILIATQLLASNFLHNFRYSSNEFCFSNYGCKNCYFFIYAITARAVNERNVFECLFPCSQTRALRINARI